MESTTHGDVGAPKAAPYVAAHETHSGVVVLAGDRAYKAKKPVQTDFLDFRTVEQREEACAREVRLNSRIAPDSYFGVAHLSGASTGAPEPIIVMRRYHDDQRLASMVKGGAPVEDVLDNIARLLADFHDRAERGPRISLQGKPEAIHQRWFENFPTTGRCYWTAWSSVMTCVSSTASMMPPSLPWTWNSSAARISATTSWTATPPIRVTLRRRRCGISISPIVPQCGLKSTAYS